jgi:hypothetical protein
MSPTELTTSSQHDRMAAMSRILITYLKTTPDMTRVGESGIATVCLNPLALELDIYSLAHHLCKMLIFYEPRSVTLGNTRHFVEE